MKSLSVIVAPVFCKPPRVKEDDAQLVMKKMEIINIVFFILILSSILIYKHPSKSALDYLLLRYIQTELGKKN